MNEFRPRQRPTQRSRKATSGLTLCNRLPSLSNDQRVDPVRMPFELRKLILHFVGERLEKQFTAGKTRLKAMKAAVPAGQSGAGATLSARVKALRSWHDKGQALLPIIKAFLKLT